MKVAIVCESPADDAVIRILLQGLLGGQIEAIPPVRLRAGGWPSARDALKREIPRTHYHTDADAIVVIVDSDDSPFHDHRVVATVWPETCRICELKSVIQSATQGLRARPVPNPLNIAIGLAVPALEAWLLCGTDQHSVEARFERDRNAGKSLFALRRELKKALYGTESPGIPLQTQIGQREARRLAANSSQLETHFPKGFGFFAKQVRAW